MKQWRIILTRKKLKDRKPTLTDLLPATDKPNIIITMKETLTSRKKMAKFKFKPTKLDELKDKVYCKLFVLAIIAFVLMLQLIGLAGQ